MHRFGKLFNVSIKTFEISINANQKFWKHKLIPFESSKKESDKVIDILIHKNHYVPSKRLIVFWVISIVILYLEDD